ncbi:MAG: hypothetical protein CMJ45_03800 [Planctomyces sp.]|nr:hypothetical protein [Planctomyces sp.]
MFVIVFTGVLTLLALVGSIGLLRLYRSTRRVTQNLEDISGIVLNRVAKPLVTLPPLLDTVKDVFGFVQELRSRDQNEDEEDESE